MTEVIYPNTLADALQSALILPGSRLLLRGGNYTVGDLRCTLSDVTIMSYPGEQAVIVPASGYRGMLLSGVSDVILDGLIFDGENLTNECLKITDGATGITVRDCVFKNGGTHGILVTGDETANVLVENCLLHHNGTSDLHHGIYLAQGGAATVRGCQGYNNAGHGIHAYSGLPTSEMLIERNYTYENGVGIGVYFGLARVYNNVCLDYSGLMTGYSIASAIIAHNTVLATGRDFDLRTISVENSEIELTNNVFAGSSESSVIHFDGAASTLFTASNNLQKHATQQIGTSGAYNESILIVADFLPVSTSGAEILPTAGNPALGAGLALAEVTTDYGGNSRGNPPTIGAWE